MRKVIKNPFVIGGTVLVVIAVLVVAGRKERGPQYETVLAQKSDLTRAVSVTGKVRPSQEVNLAFEATGRVAQINAKVGDTVRSGSALVALEQRAKQAELLQAQANLSAEQARLDELVSGTRPEELEVARTDVLNAQQALSDAEAKLNSVRGKADADLDDDYASARTTLQESVTAGKNSLLVLSDLQYAYTAEQYERTRLVQEKEEAVLLLLGQAGAGDWRREFLIPLDGGALGLVSEAILSPADKTLTDRALTDTASALQAVKDALEQIRSLDSLTTAGQSSLAAEKASMATEIASVSAARQAIAVQRATNQSAASAAEQEVNAAKSALRAKQDTLALKESGSTPEAVSAQRAKVQAAQAAVAQIQAQMLKMTIRAPFDGTVTRQDAKIGEIVAANQVLVSLISPSAFEIEAYVPEVDIASVAVGNQAQITLDAYGSEEKFEAQVSSIDPAETIIDGVATYKVTLGFVKEDDRIRSGLTANIEIISAQRQGVIAIPSRAVIRRDGETTVRVLSGGRISERPVEIGLRGSDGRIEIVSGIAGGDEVVVFVQE